MSEVFDADGPEQIEQLFDLQLDAGLHHGAQLAVYREGDLVLDLAGGVTGPDGEPTTPDRKHVLFSCTKPYAGACVHLLAEEGALDYDDAVREHWPAFAEPGTAKADVTVRHVLSHQGGFPHGPFDEEPARWIDWDAAVAAMEEIELSFEPGETAAYHALNYGFVVGELVRRASGTPIDEFARERVFEPLGMDDTHVGIPEDEPDGVATLVGFEAFDRCREPDVGLGTVDNDAAAALFNQESFHRAVIPAASGTGTARDMARFYACLAAGGELDGTRLLDSETVERATAVQAQVERDGTLGVPRRYAMGFERAGTPWDKYGTLSPDAVFGHGGLGSIVGWADPEADLAMAYVTNGIRDEYEHATRVNAMADAVRTVFA
ncbi:serine hydrolase domain-containing protein [Halegenticoccus soli]|uniref:serine hydrolase domain-containing protein n=1 Tax=Halegenticoccus soli TaxID=1985678 RepID=UPI000C6D7046|nr:serine hydrolase domain-containing protein [Halegenticoccus soli]